MIIGDYTTLYILGLIIIGDYSNRGLYYPIIGDYYMIII
jgi:hypothetical protein